MDETLLKNNIVKLQERVRSSSQNCQFGNSDILVLAASKTRPPATLRMAFENGLHHFGENYLQEAVEKIHTLQDLPIVWHFIGPIQSNKTRAIAEHFDWVHSIERAKIARRLSEQRPRGAAPLQVCIQVNVSHQDSKSGVSLEEVPSLARDIRALPNLQLRGLMAIPAPARDAQEQRSEFKAMRNALEQLQQEHPGADTLSMGMSNDLELAIAEGATIIRVGTALFGPRQ